MSNAEHITTNLCKTKDIGVGGNLFGGTIMSWLDEAGGIFAQRYSGVLRMVTVRYSELVFKHPVRVGQMVDFWASNPVIGRTSITFDLEGRVCDQVVVHTNCTFVAVDPEGRPVQIPCRND